MGSSTTAIDQLNWPDITAQLDIEGYALLPGLLAPEHARDLARHTDTLRTLRRVSLASSDLGRGELLYFDAGLPAPWSAWRATFYRYLAPIANRWNETLGSGYRYPPELEEFQKRNRQAGEIEPQSHLNRLRSDDYLSLHQRHDGEHVFPLQIVGLLTEPGSDFQGGEFVMTEQRPRMQSRPMVLPLKLGDAAIISTAQRPFKGTKGFYKVNLKHALSRVRDGERIGVELSFHDTRWSRGATTLTQSETFTLIGRNGQSYQSVIPGTLGGHRRNKLYGLLNCRAALRAIACGGYVKHRVFFPDEATAIAAGYRPCAVCLPEKYTAWKASRPVQVPGKTAERTRS